MQRVQHRPISPDVMTLDGKKPHYRMEIHAISSITTRVTGVGMSVGASPANSLFHIAWSTTSATHIHRASSTQITLQILHRVHCRLLRTSVSRMNGHAAKVCNVCRGRVL